ncbi:hypothetical protein HERIO_2390 [Hepatospora eriocheir]|uniref:Uncharacterized protein n=1 Tax=Hepatospora eriocheir TaxID=1081669 RepID=A0A1X0Q758_9MICR|nr:hypothetical protein HERIO_2390 [Hepatospora eriocheir]
MNINRKDDDRDNVNKGSVDDNDKRVKDDDREIISDRLNKLGCSSSTDFGINKIQCCFFS